MTVELDSLVRCGAVAVAALAHHSVRCRSATVAALIGEKHPVAIMVRRAGATLAFDLDGARIGLAEIERRFPGKRDEFEQLAP